MQYCSYQGGDYITIVANFLQYCTISFGYAIKACMRTLKNQGVLIGKSKSKMHFEARYLDSTTKLPLLISPFWHSLKS